MVPELVQVSSFWSCSGKDPGLARGNLPIMGAFIGSSTGYWLGRFVDIDIFGEAVKKHLENIKEKFDGKGPVAVLALRLAPTPPFTITSILAGSLKINYLKYALASTLGILPLMLLVLFFGREMLKTLKNPSAISISALIAVVILFVIFKLAKKKKLAES